VTSEPDPVVELPEDLRLELKEPLGPIYTATDSLLEAAGRPLITVGDVVTHHVIEAGETPAVALVDERTERSAVRSEISETLRTFEGFERVETVTNPAATLSAELLSALREALADGRPTLLEVDGEEDLAALPAVVLAPEGASVIYGQPGEGMVLGTVDAETKTRSRELLFRMDGDTARLRSLLGVDP
jgi:uncharacterized protein (UPF0218 family)